MFVIIKFDDVEEINEAELSNMTDTHLRITLRDEKKELSGIVSIEELRLAIRKIVAK